MLLKKSNITKYSPALYGGDFGDIVGGGISGGFMGGVSGGIDAMKHDGNFWTAKGYTMETPNFLPGDGDYTVGEGMEYSSEYGKGYLDYFPDMEHPRNYYADGTAPPGGKYKYNSKRGTFVKNNGQEAVGVTVYNGPGNGSDMYMAGKIFSSREALYLTTGHELQHVAHNSAGLFGSTKAHNSIYDWQYRQAKAWGLGDFARSYKARIYPGFNNAKFHWKNFCMDICPTKNFLYND